MVSVGGQGLLNDLRLRQEDLRYTNKRIRSISNTPLDVLGYIPVQIDVKDASGNDHSTHEAIYVVRNAPATYLSLTCCKNLDIIPPHFPLPSPPAAHATRPSSKAPAAGAAPTVAALAAASGAPVAATLSPPAAHTTRPSSTAPAAGAAHTGAALAAASGDTVAAAPPSTTKAPTGGAPAADRRRPPPRPLSLPFPASDANIPRLERWLMDAFASSAFNITDEPLPTMSGPPMKIQLKADAVPHAIHTPIPIPHHWKAKVKADLDRDIAMGIIEPVPIGTPTRHCARMVVVAKRNGEPRRTVDLSALNKQCLRETHHTPSPFDLAQAVPPNSYKTVLDAWNGYHAIPLDPASRDYMTFICEFGRFRYVRAPQGYLASGDAYTRRFNEIVRDVPRKIKIIDDSMLWDKGIEEAFFHTFDYLALCARNGITFNPSKFKFARREVEFAGLSHTDTHIKPSASMLAAIRDFPPPKDIHGARSWFGLCEQVAWAYAIKPEMHPLRELVKPSTPFYWDDELERVFQASKTHILGLVEEGVKKYQIGRPTCLATDWSKDGIGFVLLQKYCECPIASAPTCCKTGWQLVFAGSRFTTPAESNYVAVEGEAVAVADGLERCRMFVLGCPSLIVAVDHRPLVGLLNDKPLEKIDNPRLFRLKERTLRYKFTTMYTAGKWHRAPDFMSRYPCAAAESSDDIELAITAAAMAAAGSEANHVTWPELKAACDTDEEYAALTRTVLQGFPAQRQDLQPALRPYWDVREHLTVTDGICLMGTRPVVPPALRARTMAALHSAHQGVRGMRERAQLSVYWSGMDKSLRNYLDTCFYCRVHAPSQPKEPYTPAPPTLWPYESIVADYFDHAGKAYLAIADRYSGNLHVYHMPTGKATTATVISVCRALFTQYGAPKEIATDGGSTFTAHAFQEFLQGWGTTHRLSSAYYAQSNGRAELAVKAAHRVIADCTTRSGSLDTDAAARALLQYRNTPLSSVDKSPSQILFGRLLRDHVPPHPSLHRPHPEWLLSPAQRAEATARRDAATTRRYNAHAHPLRPLAVGTRVVVQNQGTNRPRLWSLTGVITEALPQRQYRIRLDGTDNTTLRNRRFIKPLRRHPPDAVAGGRGDDVGPAAAAGSSSSSSRTRESS